MKSPLKTPSVLWIKPGHGQSSSVEGNALVETLIFSLASLPFLLFVPSIGKMSDANLAAIEASRYAVWERTTSDPQHKSDQQIEMELRNRFFSDPTKLFSNAQRDLIDTKSVNNFWAIGWKEKSNIKIIDKDHPLHLINGDTPISLQLRNIDIPSKEAELLSNAVGTVGGALDSVISNSEWNFDSKGFFEATVMAQTNENRVNLSGRDCAGNANSDGSCINRMYAMLIDDWSASSPDETERAVRSLVPAGVLAPLGKVLSVVGKVPVFKDLKHTDDMFGRVYVDVLPQDRYGDPK